MKNSKKILSLVLAAMLTVSMSTTVFAAVPVTAVQSVAAQQSQGEKAKFTIDLSGISEFPGDTGTSYQLKIGDASVYSKTAHAEVTTAEQLADLFAGQSIQLGGTNYVLSVENKTTLVLKAETAGLVQDFTNSGSVTAAITTAGNREFTLVSSGEVTDAKNGSAGEAQWFTVGLS